MSLADDWDAIPAAAVAKKTLADEWDSITPAQAKAVAKAADAARPTIAGAVKTALDVNMAPAQVAANQITGLAGTVAGGFSGLAVLAKGGSIDDAARAVHETTERATYRPPEGSTGAAGVAAMESPKNPLNWWGAASNWAGEKVTDVTGSPGAGAAVNAGMNAVPLLLLKRGAAPAADAKLVGSSSIADEAAAPRAVTAAGPNLDIPTIIRQREAQGVALREVANPRAPLTLVPAESRKPGATPTIDRAERAQPVPAAAPEPVKFADSAPVATEGRALPAAEQARRREVLARVGVDDVRKSAIEGDPKAAATDFQTSRLDNAPGNHLRDVLDRERQALTAHAERIVQETGGSLGTDAHALESRGHAILAPLDAFKQFFTDQTSALYNEAKARAQGQATALPTFNELLDKKSHFTGNTDTLHLRQGITDRMGEIGMLDKEGKVLPATVDQVENLRKYINERWTPNANNVVRDLKNALDNDVTKTAGEDTYARARALHAMKKATFDDPKGISSIMDSEGAVNRKVPVEKVADTITALPNAQFDHIVKTLEHVPKELQVEAQGALAEIKAHMANRLMDQAKARQGQWGTRDVTTYLNKNAVKFDRVFTPDEMGKIRDLNDAGQILRHDASYPGAAVQEHNLVKRGAMETIRSVGAGAGALVGGLVGAPVSGAAVGGGIGGVIAHKFSEASALKAAQARTTKLSEFPK